MKTEINITQPDKLFRGDSIDFECELNLDLTGYKIRAELFDQYCRSIKLATLNAGGSDSEIEVTDDSEGLFTIYIEKDTTNCFHLVSFLEIEIEAPSGKVYTVYFAKISFEDDYLWRP